MLLEVNPRGGAIGISLSVSLALSFFLSFPPSLFFSQHISNDKYTSCVCVCVWLRGWLETRAPLKWNNDEGKLITSYSAGWARPRTS